MGVDRSESLVVGGGLVGLAAALELARRGDRVALLDAGAPRHKASLAAAGLIAPLSHKIGSPELAAACLESRDLWDDWLRGVVEASGTAVEYDASGALVAATSPDHAAVLDALRAGARRLGDPVLEVGPTELRARVPDLPADVSGGLLLPAEKRVDNVALHAALERAAKGAGVEVVRPAVARTVSASRSSVEVTTDDGVFVAARAVLAVGAWAALVEGCGPLPVRPVRGQMIRVTGAGWDWEGMVRVGDFYAVRRGPADVLFGATVEEAGFDDRTTPEAVAVLRAAFDAAFPGLAGGPLVDSWSGLRPASEDGVPVVGAWRDTALFVAGGHFRDGILLAPWTAARVADWASGTSARADDAVFSPDRFARRQGDSRSVESRPGHGG